jgi:CubicO group peptidase (beta-lactamase class C family)
MIKNTFISILFLLLASISQGQSDTTYNNLTDADSILSKDQVSLIYQKLKDYPNKTQASLAIIKNGEVFFYGVVKLKDTLMSIENSKKAFGIGSITKVFTATLLANYVLDGKIKLDEKINPYLKFQLNNNNEISFLQLANHTSGLSREPNDLEKYMFKDLGNPYKYYGEKELERTLKKRMTLTYN